MVSLLFWKEIQKCLLEKQDVLRPEQALIIGCFCWPAWGRGHPLFTLAGSTGPARPGAEVLSSLVPRAAGCGAAWAPFLCSPSPRCVLTDSCSSSRDFPSPSSSQRHVWNNSKSLCSVFHSFTVRKANLKSVCEVK